MRYADDLVVLCPTRQRAEQARQLVAAVLAPLGLRLHPDKTRIVSPRQGRGGLRLLGLPPSQGGVVEVAGSLLPARVAVGPGHGLDPGARSVNAPTGATPGWPVEWRGRRPQPRAAGLGQLLPARQLDPEVQPRRQLRPPADGPAGQHQARAPRHRTGSGGSTTAGSTRSASTGSAGTVALRDCACLTMNDVGEPCAGEPHARFDRGPLAKRATGSTETDEKPYGPASGTGHGPTATASGLPHRCWPISTPPVRPSPGCCGRATPAQAPPSITSPCSTTPSPSCQSIRSRWR